MSTIYLHHPKRMPRGGYLFLHYAHSPDPDKAERLPPFLKKYSRENYQNFRFSAAEIARVKKECSAELPQNNTLSTEDKSESPAERRTRLLSLKVQGMKIKDMAKQEGVSEIRIKQLLKEARDSQKQNKS